MGPPGHDLTTEEFDLIQNLSLLKKLPDTQKRAALKITYEALQEILGKAGEIIRKMERFSFKAFENRFGIQQTVHVKFFHPGLKFEEIAVDFLKSFEQ